MGVTNKFKVGDRVRHLLNRSTYGVVDAIQNDEFIFVKRDDGLITGGYPHTWELIQPSPVHFEVALADMRSNPGKEYIEVEKTDGSRRVEFRILSDKLQARVTPGFRQWEDVDGLDIAAMLNTRFVPVEPADEQPPEPRPRMQHEITPEQARSITAAGLHLSHPGEELIAAAQMYAFGCVSLSAHWGNSAVNVGLSELPGIEGDDSARIVESVINRLCELGYEAFENMLIDGDNTTPVISISWSE